MRIKEKINLDMKGLVEHGPITIVAFGDSVTHGAFNTGEIDQDRVYHRVLARKISAVRAYMPVNVINAGIGGITAKGSLDRMDAHVLSHNPDLVIVCFGLNDVNGSLEDYRESLRTIFSRTLERGIETVLLTPNMLNTYVRDDIPESLVNYAGVTARAQNSGKMDTYIEAAREVAREMGVKIADAYAEWKRLAECEDTTALLANGINHPTREMHELFADVIFREIFDEESVAVENDSTMYRGK